MRSAPSGGWDSAVRLDPSVDLLARAAVSVETSKKIMHPSAIGRMARSAVLLLSCLFRCGFLFAPRIRARPGIPAWARRRRPHPLRRRGLVHACLIVIHNWRKPALGLRDAHTIAAGVIPRVLSLARSRDAAVWHPNKREYQEP